MSEATATASPVTAAEPAPMTRLDISGLVTAINTVIAHRNISASEAAREIGITASVMSDLRRHGKIPAGDTLLLVLAWLRAPAGKYVLKTPVPVPVAA